MINAPRKTAPTVNASQCGCSERAGMPVYGEPTGKITKVWSELRYAWEGAAVPTNAAEGETARVERRVAACSRVTCEF